MARTLRVLYEGALYHVTFRGNARQPVFLNDEDKGRLLSRLAESAEAYQVRIHLYCLMENHVHLLVGTPRANLDRFMGSVLTGYTVYFNRRHNRVGHLMQGRYGAQLVEGDEYLLRLSRYIHLNPVHVAGWKDRPLKDRLRQLREYQWSSYRAFVGLSKPEEGIVYAPIWAAVPGRGSATKRYRHFVEGGLAKTDKEFVDLVRSANLAVGSEAFVADVQRRHEEASREVKREDVSLRGVLLCRSAGEVRTAVADLCMGGADVLQKRKHGWAERAVLAWALQKYAGLNQRAISKELGVGTGAAVSHLLRALKRRHPPKATAMQAKLNLIFKG